MAPRTTATVAAHKDNSADYVDNSITLNAIGKSRGRIQDYPLWRGGGQGLESSDL